MSLYDPSKQASIIVDQLERYDGAHAIHNRTAYSIFSHAMSEMGELAQEIMIVEGHSYKHAGKDGIIGEAIDTIMCLLDIIHKTDSNLTEKDLEHIMTVKAQKWIDKIREYRKDVPL